jgi:hypothetical protein
MVTKMDQMGVYRVECPKSRLGMYFAKGDTRVATMEMSTDRHPGPWSDRRLKDEVRQKGLEGEASYELFHRECKFGFASKKQMRDWVHKDEWKEKLEQQGLIVAKYLIPKDKVAIGSTQAIYDPSHAKLVATMPPTKI